jgi:hypothetical protein
MDLRLMLERPTEAEREAIDALLGPAPGFNGHVAYGATPRAPVVICSSRRCMPPRTPPVRSAAGLSRTYATV